MNWCQFFVVFCALACRSTTATYNASVFNTLTDIQQHLFDIFSTNSYSYMTKSGVTGESELSDTGYPIWLMHFSKDVDDEREIIWVDCGIEGIDLIPITTCMYIIDELDKASKEADDYNKELAAALEVYDFYVIPVVNPEGYQVNLEGTEYEWRKNMQNGNDCKGVNINRNFNVSWEEGSTLACSGVYRGEQENDQEETNIIIKYLEKGKIVAVFHIEGFGEMWLYPYASDMNFPDNLMDLIEYSQAAVEAINMVDGTIYTCNQIAENYVFGDGRTRASGTLIDYAFINKGISKTFMIAPRKRRYSSSEEDILVNGEEVLAGILAVYAKSATTTAP